MKKAAILVALREQHKQQGCRSDGRHDKVERDKEAVPEPYFISHHHTAAKLAVIAMDIRSDNAISLTHSQFDTEAPNRPQCRNSSWVKSVAKTSGQVA